MSRQEQAKTGVFWDLEDCPIPEGLSSDSIHAKIKKALENKGYGGALSIRAYGEKETFPDELLDKYRNAGIAIVQGGKDARVYKMACDILLWLVDNNRQGTTIMIFLDLSADTEFLKSIDYDEFLFTVQNLKSRGYKVVLAQPDEVVASEDLARSVASIWLSTSLWDEGNPVELTGICVDNFDDFNSAEDLEVLGSLRLKIELQLRGMKCGGTLQERAARLFLLKSTPLERLPKKVMAKEKK